MTADGPEDDPPDSPDKATDRFSDPDDVALSVDTILSLLANTQRRELLHHLREASSETCAVDDCIAHILRREEAMTGERPGHDHVAARLHHVHIPKLAEAGVIDYDARSQTIRYWGHERLEDWFEHIRAKEPAP